MSLAVRAMGSFAPGSSSIARQPPASRQSDHMRLKFHCNHLPQLSQDSAMVPSLSERSVKPIASLQEISQKSLIKTQKRRSPSPLPESSANKVNDMVGRESVSRKRSRRSYFPFSSNRTISRQGDGNHTHDLINLKSENLEDFCLLEDLHDRIEDHAYRRLQIFYFQCLAYFNEKCRITLGHTNLQHGSSSCPSCSAAHSSILPNVNDDLFKVLKDGLLYEAPNPQTIKKLKSLGVTDERIAFFMQSERTPFMVDWLLSDIAEDMDQSLMTAECPFYDIMNSTVELPAQVNEFDTIIERNLRGTAVEILNEVSEGLHPYKGVQKLEWHLQTFFKESEREAMDKVKLLKELHENEVNLRKQEDLLRGHKVNNISEWTKSYAGSASRIQAIQALLNEKRYYSGNLKLNLRMPWHQSLFNIISVHCNKEREYLERIDRPKELQAYAKNIISKTQKICAMDHEMSEILSRCRTETCFEPLKSHLKKFWELCNPVDFLFPDNEKVKGLFNAIADSVTNMPMWYPESINDYLKKMDESLQICRLQAGASVAPPYEQLSGGFSGGKLAPLDEESLFEQKLELWRRN